MVYFILKWFIIFVTDATTVLFDLDLLNEKMFTPLIDFFQII